MATRRTDTGTKRKAPAKPARKSLTTQGPKRTTITQDEVIPVAPVVIERTWWERTLYAIARIWSQP